MVDYLLLHAYLLLQVTSSLAKRFFHGTASLMETTVIPSGVSLYHGGRHMIHQVIDKSQVVIAKCCKWFVQTAFPVIKITALFGAVTILLVCRSVVSTVRYVKDKTQVLTRKAGVWCKTTGFPFLKFLALFTFIVIFLTFRWFKNNAWPVVKRLAFRLCMWVLCIETDNRFEPVPEQTQPNDTFWHRHNQYNQEHKPASYHQQQQPNDTFWHRHNQYNQEHKPASYHQQQQPNDTFWHRHNQFNQEHKPASYHQHHRQEHQNTPYWQAQNDLYQQKQQQLNREFFRMLQQPVHLSESQKLEREKRFEEERRRQDQKLDEQRAKRREERQQREKEAQLEAQEREERRKRETPVLPPPIYKEGQIVSWHTMMGTEQIQGLVSIAKVQKCFFGSKYYYLGKKISPSSGQLAAFETLFAESDLTPLKIQPPKFPKGKVVIIYDKTRGRDVLARVLQANACPLGGEAFYDLKYEQEGEEDKHRQALESSLFWP